MTEWNPDVEPGELGRRGGVVRKQAVSQRPLPRLPHGFSVVPVPVITASEVILLVFHSSFQIHETTVEDIQHLNAMVRKLLEGILTRCLGLDCFVFKVPMTALRVADAQESLRVQSSGANGAVSQ